NPSGAPKPTTPTDRSREMSDLEDRQIVLQANIFEPRVSAEQHALAIRYDALRSALGKFGRPFGNGSSLVLPAPVLHLEPEEVWHRRTADWAKHGFPPRPRRAFLEFLAPIQRAASVTLLNDARLRVDRCTFTASELTEVIDPGPGGTLEVRDKARVTFLVGVPVRVSDATIPNKSYEE